MDFRPNWGPDTPAFQVEMLEHSLAERYRTLVRWEGPKQPAFNTYNARLRSFDKGWPHRHHNAELFCAAGFFYTGMDLTITIVQNNVTTLRPYITIFHIITDLDDKTVFSLWGRLKELAGFRRPLERA
jgi:hypothetical protein